jgi:hypothetical protein
LDPNASDLYSTLSYTRIYVVLPNIALRSMV